MSEQWRTIPGWRGAYEVSDLGRVKSLRRRVWSSRGHWRTVPERVLMPSVVRRYEKVTLQRDGRQECFAVHRLVLLAFVGPCPEGMEACHYDDNPRNNALENLRWDTRSANHIERTRNGGNPNALKTQCPRGHPYTAENTYHDGRSRKCRKCTIRRAVEYKRRKRQDRKATA